ncbi:MAG: hypothetical protein ACRETZ_02855 [Steroidobacteraceae bacterium]
MRKRISGFTAGALSVLTAALAVLPACRSSPADAGIPAIIPQPTAASRADLALAVSQAFHGAAVRLAGDALTRGSLLIVGRAQARDLRGLALNGRRLEHPQHFRLLRRGSQCVLLHLETGKSRVLTHTTCRASPARPSRG